MPYGFVYVTNRSATGKSMAHKCRYQLIFGRQSHRNAALNVAADPDTDDASCIFIFPPGGVPGRRGEHAMTPCKNVIVDVRVCALSLGSNG
jgi:hypothetical protein